MYDYEMNSNDVIKYKTDYSKKKMITENNLKVYNSEADIERVYMKYMKMQIVESLRKFWSIAL